LSGRGWTAAEGRRFGLTVGAALLALAGVSWWRGSVVAGSVVAILGSLLVAAGLLLPVELEPVHRAWMAVALAISRVTTPILMGIVFLVAITPIAVALRLMGRNPLEHRAPANGGYWKARPPESRARTDLEHQF
jgi:hypothetical protein